jgi:hypothetical protein
MSFDDQDAFLNIRIIRYVFRSYDHLNVEIHTSEIKLTGNSLVGIMVAGSWRTYKWLLLVSYYCVLLPFLVWFLFCPVEISGFREWGGGVCLCVRVGVVVRYLFLFVVVHHNVEDWVVYVCVYVNDL